MRRIFRIVLLAFLTLAGLIVLASILLTLPPVQQRITRQTESWLQEKLGTRVEIGAIRLRFPYYVSLNRFLLEDQRGDTLARVNSLVVDVDMWALLDQAIELKKITLEDAAVHLHRRDSIYNFDFVVEAFSDPDAPETEPADTVKSPWKLQLDLATLDLENVDFSLQDEDAGSAMFARVGTAGMVISKADLDAMHFEVSDLSLSDSDIRMQQTRKSVSEEATDNFSLWLEDGLIERSHILFSTTELFLETRMEEATLEDVRVNSFDEQVSMQVGDLTLENSSLAYRDPEVKSTPGHLNAGDLDATSVTADISGFSFRNDTLALLVNHLAATDKSGIWLNHLKGQIMNTPTDIVLNNLSLRLNERTTVISDVALTRTEKGDLDQMRIELWQAKGVVHDLLVAMPPLDNPAVTRLRDIPFDVTGDIVGSMNYLQTRKVELHAGTGTTVYLDGALQHLQTPERMGLDLNISRLETNRSDLLRWMSLGDTPADSLMATPLPAFVSAAGSLNGSLADLQVSLAGEVGALQTGRPSQEPQGLPLQFDVAGRLTEVSDPDRLGLDLTLQRMQAPGSFFAFLRQENLTMPDLLSATGTLKGTLASLQTDLRFIATRDGDNSELALNGLLQNLRAPDSLGFDVAFNGAITRGEIYAYLPDTPAARPIRLPAVVQVEGQASGTVENMTTRSSLVLGDWGRLLLDGNLRDTVYDATITAQNLAVSRLMVDSALQPLKTTGFRAQVAGSGFDFGNTASARLNATFDSVIWENMVLRDITLAGDVAGKKFNARFNSPDERVAVNAKISGDFGPEAPLLQTDIVLNCLDLREFGWARRPTTVCMRIRSESEGLSLDTLFATATIEDMDLQYDTVHVRPGDLALEINFLNRNNSVVINSDWLQGELKGYFSIAGLPKTIDNIAEQYFAVDRTAQAPPAGNDSLRIRLRITETEYLTTGLIPGLRELSPLSLEASLDARRQYFELDARVPHLAYLEWEVDSLNARAQTGDTAAVFMVSSPRIERREEVFVENASISGQFAANRGTVALAARDADGRERYRLAASAEFSQTTRTTVVRLEPRQIIDFHEWQTDPENRVVITPKGLDIEKVILQGNGQSVRVEGSTLALNGGKTGIDLELEIGRLNLQNFDTYLGQYINEMAGWMQADLDIEGTTDALQVRGDVLFHETVVTPALNNVRYELSETPLEFTDRGIRFDGLTLKDPDGNTLAIDGSLATTDWKNIRSDLRLHAEQWQVLNTTRRHNETYFGHVFIDLDGTVRGDLNEPEILLSVKTARESDFTYIYDAATQTLQHEGIVLFLEPARQYVRPPIYDAPVTRNAFTLSASIEIDSNLAINSVVNPVTGDDFNGRANGQMQFDLLPNGNMTLAGRVDLVRGVYNYSYQGVVKRSFMVGEGSSIIWSGDVRNPELQLTARYVFQASPYPLVANQLSAATPGEVTLYRRSRTFYLRTDVTGTPLRPDLKFQFVYPSSAEQTAGIRESFSNANDGLVNSAISNVNEDPNLLSRQIFGVLLLRNFIGESGGLTTNSSGGDPLRSGLNSFLTSQVNALAQQYLTFIDVQLEARDAATSANNGATSAEGTTSYQLRLEKSFFEDRLTFKLSSSATTGGAGGDEMHSALENASAEYSLTRDGNLRLTVFSERGFELLNASAANLRNSGAGILVTKEFKGKRQKD